MPIYDYVCAACSHRFEVIHGVHADGPATCPSCGEGPVRKAFSAPTIHFKGSGWAKKDRSTKRTPTPASAAAGGSDGSAAGDSTATDATPASGGPTAIPAAQAPAAGSTTSDAGSKPTSGGAAAIPD